ASGGGGASGAAADASGGSGRRAGSSGDEGAAEPVSTASNVAASNVAAPGVAASNVAASGTADGDTPDPGATAEAAAGPVSTVRLASPGSVIASIPFLFGFHPENSLVILGISHSAEGGSFIRHGVRIDLDQVRGQERGTALELAARLRDQDADIAILVAFGPRAATGAKARPDHCRKLMAAFRAQLEAAASEERVTVVDALYSANGRWWSYMCRNNRCCPAAGTVVPAEAPAALAGAFATRGHTVYASREALDATLDPYPPEALTRTAAAAEHLDPTWYDTDAGLADARRLMDVLLARCGADAEPPTSRTPRADGPRAGRRGLSDSATTALAGRSAAADVQPHDGSGAGSGAGTRGGRSGRAADLAASHPDDVATADGSAVARSGRSAASGSQPRDGFSGSAASPSSQSDADDAPASPGSADNSSALGGSAFDDPAFDGPASESSASDSSPADQSEPRPPHSTGAVIPAARNSRRVSNRIPSLAGKSEGVPLGALAEPPGSLLAPPVIADGEAAELLIALLNWRVRDYLACAAATVDSAGRLLRLGAELARRAPHPELRLAPYALAAWAAWAIGRPAIAQCAVDRALAIDPEYKFASLIRAGLHHAIDGEGVRESAASTRRDLFGEAAVDSDTVAGFDNGAGFDSSDPDSAPAPIPSPRSTETVPTESGTDLEIS
ncbi:DUF4192 domain-containing protein, partial [Catenulispora pinisilvae]|uniref:DUF4192 domain-containing protein n=1 Tax=Catenulispora pinisilvae TaxID=2705253 RepID=UPI001E5CA2DF